MTRYESFTHSGYRPETTSQRNARVRAAIRARMSRARLDAFAQHEPTTAMTRITSYAVRRFTGIVLLSIGAGFAFSLASVVMLSPVGS